tara:strand:- start:782 stop:1303 length:522 start_codon:yes stop_codon:yes gene_type:complete
MSYKKFIHKYQYLKFEIDDLKKQEQSNFEEFNSHFGFENSNEDSPPLVQPQQDLLPNRDSNNPGKPLFKALSKILHPDRGGNKDEFALVSELYRKKDTVGLILKAEEYEIDIEKYLDEDLINSFESSCKLLEEEGESIKSTISWKWCNSSSDMEKKVWEDYMKKTLNILSKDN